MSDNEQKLENVPKEGAKQTTVDSAEAELESSGSSSSWAIVVAMFSLAGVCALTAALYLLVQKSGDRLDRMEQKLLVSATERKELITRIETLNKDLGALEERTGQQRKALQDYDNTFKAERDRYETGRREMLAALNEMQQRLGRSTSRWMAAEAEYLIRVANHRLQLVGDVTGALNALIAANERLRDTADPLWVPVRNQLAQDIATLQAIVPLDREGISAKLSAFSRQVETLKINPSILSHPQKMADQVKEVESSTFERVLDNGWKGFKSLVIVRRHDKPVAAMLAPEQQFFLGQNLRLQLESVRLSMLQGDQILYDDSLNTAREWLDRFFDSDDPAVSNLQGELTKLVTVNVTPDLPDISNALALLKKQAAGSEGAVPSASSETSMGDGSPEPSTTDSAGQATVEGTE